MHSLETGGGDLWSDPSSWPVPEDGTIGAKWSNFTHKAIYGNDDESDNGSTLVSMSAGEMLGQLHPVASPMDSRDRNAGGHLVQGVCNTGPRGLGVAPGNIQRTMPTVQVQSEDRSDGV